MDSNQHSNHAELLHPEDDGGKGEIAKMTRRIGNLDTPDKCCKECERVYKDARNGKIAWVDALDAATFLERLWKMVGGSTDGGAEQSEVKWSDVGNNAVHR